MRQPRNRVRPLTGSLAAAAALLLALSAAPARAAVVERFDTDPLAPGGSVPFFGDGDVASHFAWLPDEPPHFPGDRSGTLRVLYDTTLPAGRIATPLGQVLSLDEDASFGAILTIRPEGYVATPEGFDQIAFGLLQVLVRRNNHSASRSPVFSSNSPHSWRRQRD